MEPNNLPPYVDYDSWGCAREDCYDESPHLHLDSKAIDFLSVGLRELSKYGSPHPPHKGTECGICLARQLGLANAPHKAEES